MSSSLNDWEPPRVSQDSRKDLLTLVKALKEGVNFCFIRFSDGEMEIINNHELVIAKNYIKTSLGEVAFDYPTYDYKSFLPERDKEFRLRLIESATYRAPGYLKGIRTKSNRGASDQAKMIKLNNNEIHNLTFTDLLINSNFKEFRKKMLPVMESRENIYVVANFRAEIPKAFKHGVIVPVQDNFVPNFKSQLDEVMHILGSVPKNSLILSSASSLSNLIGFEIWKLRQDVTFIDIGTAIHDKLGLGFGIREYQQVLEKTNIRNLHIKVKYFLSKGYRIKW